MAALKQQTGHFVISLAFTASTMMLTAPFTLSFAPVLHAKKRTIYKLTIKGFCELSFCTTTGGVPSMKLGLWGVVPFLLPLMWCLQTFPAERDVPERCCCYS